MNRLASGSLVLAALAVGRPAPAQELYAVDFPGNLYRVNTTTGAATLIGNTGTDRLNSAAANNEGVLFATRSRDPSIPTDTNRLIRIDRTTGMGMLIVDWGTANDIRGLAVNRYDGRMYGTRDNNTADDLVAIDPGTGAVTLIGPTGQTDIQGLTAGSANLYAVGVEGRLYRIDPATGAATVIATVSGGISGGDLQTVEWRVGIRAFTGRSSLWALDLGTGIANMIGPFGVSDVRGLGIVRCYPDCEPDSALNVNDFICFQAAFAAAVAYADCDRNNALNVNDFVCFQAAFAAGCP
jgi:hypothetical protein